MVLYIGMLPRKLSVPYVKMCAFFVDLEFFHQNVVNGSSNENLSLVMCAGLLQSFNTRFTLIYLHISVQQPHLNIQSTTNVFNQVPILFPFK